MSKKTAFKVAPLPAAVLMTSVLSLMPLTAHAEDSGSTKGNSSSDQTKVIFNDFDSGSIEMYKNKQSVRIGTLTQENTPPRLSLHADINAGQLGLIGEDVAEYRRNSANLSLIDLQANGTLDLQLRDGIEKRDIQLEGISLLNLSATSALRLSQNPFQTTDSNILSLGWVSRSNEALGYDQTGVSIQGPELSTHRSIQVGDQALLDICTHIQPIEFVLGENHQSKEPGRNHYRTNQGVVVSPTGLFEVCAGLTSANGKWSVHDQLSAATDYISKSERRGYGRIQNTLSVDRKNVGLYYSVDSEHQGGEQELTHEVGLTVQRRTTAGN